MGNADPGDIFDGGGSEFMKSAQKKALAAAKTPIAILGATPKTASKYGDETRFDVAINRGQERYTICMKWNEVRQRQAESVLQLLASGHSSVGPVFLIQVDTKSGNKAWALSKDAMEGPVLDIGDGEESAPPDESQASPAGGHDDDIPF